ncbi:hypothetical protein [Metabacillus fastidiosus]|uniref:hypothetical protein n=1 Tax=Metabacillus fastidiosus TaxID=1458 RepID=UPI003D2CB115
MEYEVNKLINSGFEMLEKIGWLIYNRENQNRGLSKEELYDLLRITTVQEMEKEYHKAYDEGVNDTLEGN